MKYLDTFFRFSFLDRFFNFFLNMCANIGLPAQTTAEGGSTSLFNYNIFYTKKEKKNTCFIFILYKKIIF